MLREVHRYRMRRPVHVREVDRNEGLARAWGCVQSNQLASAENILNQEGRGPEVEQLLERQDLARPRSDCRRRRDFIGAALVT